MRKLDALVAERIFGHGVEKFAIANPVPTGGMLRKGKTDPKDIEELPFYSTDISAAWEVVTKFPMWTLEKNKLGKFVCLLTGFNNTSLVVHISTTAPLAICHAALRACGVSEDEIKEAMKE